MKIAVFEDDFAIVEYLYNLYYQSDIKTHKQYALKHLEELIK